jgi:putative transposase
MMRNVSGLFRYVRQLAAMLISFIVDAVCYFGLCLRPSSALAAESLFLRKQLALYEDRQVKPRRATNAMRLAMVGLSYWFKWKSKRGRPALSKDLRALIRRMALENPTWGQERIANELLLKLGLQVSPRTVRKCMPNHGVGSPGKRRQTQRWSTFLRNHAKGILACDFGVAITATFHMLYVFVVIEHRSRRLVHVNVTAHPTAQWTMQQFREAIPADHPYRILIHDRDSIFTKEVDQGVRSMGLRVIKTPVRIPVANSIGERVMGTLRRECLDFVIPLNEKHLYGIWTEWLRHYNEGRSHMSLGPGIPQPPTSRPVPPLEHRHRLPEPLHIVSRPVLSGLHHEYQLEQQAA